MELRDLIIACQTRVGATPDGNPSPDTWQRIYDRLAETTSTPAYVVFADGNHNDPWPPPADIPAFTHKATEGTYFRDSLGGNRRIDFKGKGGKWGWYHFTSGENVTDQANAFLAFIDNVGYQADDLICLDFEESNRTGDCNITTSEAELWIQIVEAKLGCKVCIYGSDLLTGALRADPNAFSGHPLWPAWYHPSPPVLPSNRKWAIWQFTSNGKPYSDMDRYPGSESDLRRLGLTFQVRGLHA